MASKQLTAATWYFITWRYWRFRDEIGPQYVLETLVHDTKNLLGAAWGHLEMIALNIESAPTSYHPNDVHWVERVLAVLERIADVLNFGSAMRAPTVFELKQFVLRYQAATYPLTDLAQAGVPVAFLETDRQSALDVEYGLIGLLAIRDVLRDGNPPEIITDWLSQRPAIEAAVLAGEAEVQPILQKALNHPVPPIAHEAADWLSTLRAHRAETD